jgi:hypothetical protein
MLQIVGWVGGGEIVIPMPEALSFAESRRQKCAFAHVQVLFRKLQPPSQSILDASVVHKHQE